MDREDAADPAAARSHRRGEVRGRGERALRSRRLRGRGCRRLHRARSTASAGSRRANLVARGPGDRLPHAALGARRFAPDRRRRGPGRHRRGGRLHLSRPADPGLLRQAGRGEPRELRHEPAAARSSAGSSPTTREANVAFDCPGHQGGQFYRKSPAGQLFFKHFGEQIFRNDLCNADVDLGDLLIHEGAAALAQRHAARVFGADKTYFVLNGTSTSNKVVTNAVLRRGDLVLFDRNNHKSLHQGALVQAGAIPIFLPTARNPFGMIGAVDWDAWDEADAPGADPDQPPGRGSRAAQGGAALPARLHPARDLRRHGLQRPQGPGEDRAPVRLRAVGRGLDRLQRLPSAVRGPQSDAAHGPGARDAGALLHPVGAQAGRGLLAGLADPQARRAHPGPARATSSTSASTSRS